MTTSKFMTQGETYIGHAAKYLEARGLTIQDTPILPYKNVNLGFTTKDGSPFIPEGWAYLIRRPEGEYYEDRWLLRVENWPKEDLYQKKQGKPCLLTGAPPKFIQISAKGADCTNYISTIDELCHSNIVTWHEKTSSAALSTKLTDIPSIALSGCTNWSSEGRLRDGLESMVRLMKADAQLVVCFDGDIIENPNVMHAASQLKGWINALRKDITVHFPLVPPMAEGLNGWDDFIVAQGENAQAVLLEIFGGVGVDVISALPVQYLVSEFQVKVKVVRDKVVIMQTAENYARLLNHPMWTPYIADVDGSIYNRDNFAQGRLPRDVFYDMYEMWLADSAFGMEGEHVRGLAVKQAAKKVMTKRQESVPLLLLAQQPPVTRQQAMDAALRLSTEGIKVVGPMTKDQTAETFIRIARDMVALWSVDPYVDIQWALALVGPSGCGKSNFPKSFTACFNDWGFRPSIAQLAKEGNRSNLDELLRQCRDSLIGVFDEYNPDERSARIVEQNIFTLSTTRLSHQRRLHEEDSSEMIRRAAIMLTTVDRNKSYGRSAKGAGERRFITMEVEGVKLYGDKMTSDRVVIKECGAILLRYGYQLFLDGETAPATEYSEAHTGDYVGAAPIVARIAGLWARQEIAKALGNFKNTQYRKQTDDVRFSMPQMVDMLLPGETLGRMDKGDFHTLVLDCGAEDIGKGRVNTPNGEVMKDKAYLIADWDAWCIELQAKLC